MTVQYSDSSLIDDIQAKSQSFAAVPVSVIWKGDRASSAQLGVFINRFGERFGFNAVLARLQSGSEAWLASGSGLGTGSSGSSGFDKIASESGVLNDNDDIKRRKLDDATTCTDAVTIFADAIPFPAFRCICNVVGALHPLLKESFAETFHRQVYDAVHLRVQRSCSAFNLILEMELTHFIARTLLHRCCRSPISCWLWQNSALADRTIFFLRYVFDCEADDTEWPRGDADGVLSGLNALTPLQLLLDSLVPRPECVAFLLSRGAYLNVKAVGAELAQLDNPAIENVRYCKACGMTSLACIMSRTLCVGKHSNSVRLPTEPMDHGPVVTESLDRRRKRLTEALALRKAYTDGLIRHLVESIRFTVLAELTAGYLSADLANR